MRPFGHTEAKEEREMEVVAEQLQELFSRYRERIKDPPAMGWSAQYFASLHQTAMDVLRPVAPTIGQLHRFLLSCPIPYDAYVSEFITGGYQILPEKTIRYDLHTPGLDRLGWGLEGKHLIVEGELGIDTGSCMQGRLTIIGRVDNDAGHGMHGAFHNRGVCGEYAGMSMVGTFVNHGVAMRYAGQGMIGRYIDRGTAYNGGVDVTGYRGGWGMPLRRRKKFLADLKNPHDLPLAELRKTLREEYR
jgi:hypothetical protein